MRKKIAVVGAGQMGRAIAYAMDTLDYNLIILDQNQTALSSCKKLLPNKKRHTFSRFECDIFDGQVNQAAFNILKGADAVISSLPYHKNSILAKQCIPDGIAYFDLGGHVGTSETINDITKQTNGTCFTDLGLAPGWANIIAEELCDQLEYEGKHPKNVQIMVGGLPIQPNNILKYSCTWSFDGLINEYKDDCVVLKDRLILTASGMDGFETVASSLGDLEAFYTSGGVAHSITSMLKRGVVDCSYKTLRYPGHHNIVKFLIRESGLSDEEIIQIFKRSCPPQEDLVIIKVLVNDISYEKVILCDENFSAMQKATAFPIASAVHTVLLNERYKGVLKYSDIEHTQFNKHLNNLLNPAISE